MVAPRGGAAAVSASGIVRRLDGRSAATQRLTAEHVQDPERLAREVNELRDKAAAQDNRHNPRRVDFEDVAVDGTGTTKYRLAHHLGGRVRWWVVDWAATGGGGNPVALEKHADTDADTLVLVSGTAGTVTVRIEAAG